MSNTVPMSPFVIRLELLKMARDMLNDDYYGKREQISNLKSMASRLRHCQTQR